MKFDLLIQNLKTGIKYIDLQKRLENNKSQFTHYPPFWRYFNSKLSHVNFNWQFIDFASSNDPAVPPNTPGVYLFVMQPPYAIFDNYCHIMYVGMSDEGLIERLNKGYRSPSLVKARPHIHRLILDYGKYLRWYYISLNGFNKAQLREVESFLIGYFCNPPINRTDAPVEIANANKSKLF